MTTIATVPTVTRDAERVLKINYAKSKETRIWREIYLVQRTNWNGISFDITAYGKKGSFAISSWDTEKEALEEFSALMKEGK